MLPTSKSRDQAFNPCSDVYIQCFCLFRYMYLDKPLPEVSSTLMLYLHIKLISRRYIYQKWIKIIFSHHKIHVAKNLYPNNF